MTDEEKTNEEPEAPTEDNADGGKSEADKKVEQLNADTERINQAIAENENAKARQKLGGVAEAGQSPEKPKEETPKEYNDRIDKETSEGKHDD